MPTNTATINGVPYIVGQIPGSGTNDSPSAGNLGEILSATGTGVSLVNNTAKTIISKALTPGRWEVTGIVVFIPAASTTITDGMSEVTSTDNTIALTVGNFARLGTGTALTPAGRKIAIPTPPQRILVPSSGNVTYYLIAQCEFASSTMTADGFIRALRV